MNPSKSFFAPILTLLLLISCSQLCAQVGNDNPTGPTGIFNGNVTTGCSYDPYTGNAVRSITDMVVAGSVGSYGLSYSRTWNTRNPGWYNSYEWSIDDVRDLPSGQPIPYVVNFPDGRSETFGPTGQQGGIWRAAAGVRERLKPWDGTFCYLVLPDGGKVKFQVTMTSHIDGESHQTYYNYSFSAPQAIIDPHGQITALIYNPDGSLDKITEPAQRSIQLFYVPGMGLIDYIKSSTGQEVHYGYQTQTIPPGTIPYTVLTNVTYSTYYGGSDDPALTATYTYRSPNVGSANGPPLLSTCDDPMYEGPMKKINYTYKIGTNPDGSDAVYAQLDSEASINGIPVSSLAVTDANTRTETRGDGPSRTFTYTNGYLTSWKDFKGVPSSQTYDDAMYVASVTDGRGNTTNYTNNPLTGAVTQVQHPLTPSDDPANSPRGTLNYTYGWANCPDLNNRDANNPYYLYSIMDEAGNETRFTRDSNKRVTRIDYPDGAYETFSYNSFDQVLSHVMRTGGTETFEYDGRGLKQVYRDPDHATGNPTARYQYDALDRLSGVTDALGGFLGDGDHTVSYVYNTRGQLRITTLPTDPVEPWRHTIVNSYNSNGDGTLVSKTDPLGHTTNYTYDDYRRVRSITTPQRFPTDSTARTTYASYDTYQSQWDDYTHTDANVTRLTLPSGKLIKASYDPNRRKSSVAASGADGTTDFAATGFEYDDAGNLSLVKEPDLVTGQPSASRATTYNHDERNRLESVVDAFPHTTFYQYDGHGRKQSERRPNGQVITYNSYDQMNRVLQQTVTQAPTASAVTNYTWWPSGLLHTMEDPNEKFYIYQYDLLGRKLSLTYPSDHNVTRSELYTYDQVTGHLQTYTNRAGAVQTFFFDALNRPTGFDWNDGFTPQVRITYDAASRIRQVWNWDATINNIFFDDNTLLSQEETTPDCGDNTPRTISYTYDADGNRGTMKYYYGDITYNYHYTGRNQLEDIKYQNYAPMIAYQYDKAGNRTVRSIYDGTTTDYAPVDALNRSSWVRHTFADGQTARTAEFDYAFDEMSRLKYEQRPGGTADGYTYNQAGEVIGQIRDGTLSDGTVIGTNLPLSYDAAGNRTNTWGIPYTTNDLNQYTSVGGAEVTSDANGNTHTRGGWTYTYDAQNRLRNATDGTKKLDFYYDGLNRQITRSIQTGSGQKITFSVWDGSNLLEERGPGDVLQRVYFYGAKTDELVCAFGGTQNNSWVVQDGRGNVSHIFSQSNELVERYTYGLSGEPQIWDASGTPLSESAVENRFMFQGRDYLKEGAIYDYRNRFYLPSLGRFLQPDPLGFGGGDANLYRYCGNDPVNLKDPLGLDVVVTLQEATGLARGFDHIGLGVNTTDTQGFYGSNSFNSQGVIGQVKSDNPTSNEILGSITITTTPAQDAIIAGVFAQFNGTQYDFFDRNCATAIAAALQAAGLKFDSSNIPYALFINLAKAYPPGHGSRVTYPNGVKGGPYGNGGGGGGGGGGESPSGGSSPGVSVIPSIQIGGYYNVDPNSDFFRNLMAAYPNATVVQQSGPFGGGGKNVPILMLF